MSALFKTLDEVKEYLAVNIGSNIDSILPSIRRAEKKFIIPLLGKEQYEDLLDWYHESSGSVSGSDSGSGSGIPLTDQEQQDLLEKVQEPLINLAYLLYIPIGNLQISDSGFGVAETANKKIAAQWRIDDLKESFEDGGNEGLDFLLEFLEDNADTYDLWKGSSAYTVFKQFFINTAKEFSQLYDIRGSRLTFLALTATMKKVEEFQIASVISQPLFDEIKTQIAGELSADNKILLDDHIKPALAHLTVSRAAVDLTVQITEAGIFIKKVEDEKIQSKAKAPDPNISAVITAARTDGMAYIERMESFLNENADKYPLYKASDLFDDTDNASDNEFDNKKDNNHYAV